MSETLEPVGDGGRIWRKDRRLNDDWPPSGLSGEPKESGYVLRGEVSSVVGEDAGEGVALALFLPQANMDDFLGGGSGGGARELKVEGGELEVSVGKERVERALFGSP